MSPKAVDVFCGAGGLSLGLSSAGFSLVAGIDNDPICIRTVKRNSHYLDHPVLELDLSATTAERVLDSLSVVPGELDLLAGGPPCQGFSVQRTIGGDSDSRNSLVDDYGDLILALAPKFFVIENVTGLGGKRGREMLEGFKARMSRHGYYLHQETLDAQQFGVPQRRRRLIVVGERLQVGENPLFQWPVPLSGPKRTVREALSGLPKPPTDGSAHPQFANHRADRPSELNRQRLAALKPGQGRTSLPKKLVAKCHQVDADTIGHRNVYGRMAWDDVAPTITARFDSFTRGKFGHPEELRSISLREGARLQTFPDDYVFEGSKVEIARQIGNAVPPRLAEAIGRAILLALSRRGELT